MQFIPYALPMAPYLSATPWGGTRLMELPGKGAASGDGPFGESWEVSDHPAGRSRIAAGPYAGEEFGSLIARFPIQMLGVRQAPGRFPLLIKYINTARNLSIQVHPGDAQAPDGERGKNECWYVIDCAADAQIVLGLRPGVGVSEIAAATRSNRLETCVSQVPISPGDFIYIPTGTVHAILGETLICEVQQASNTTYRLWDWGREPKRKLHIEEACAVINYDCEEPPQPIHALGRPVNIWSELVANDFFRVEFSHWDAWKSCEADEPNPHGWILNVVGGEGRFALEEEGMTVELVLGGSWFIPAGLGRYRIEAGSNGLKLLRSQSLELD